jgi:CheY-like chemotaxis protein
MSDDAARKHTIVCVEADAENRRLISEVLEATGEYRVIGAPDGVNGLEQIKEHCPVLALVDLDLPVISAYELLRRLRGASHECSKTPLVAVSASVMKGERQRCLRAGFMAFLEKPFDIHELRARVSECVRKSPVRGQATPPDREATPPDREATPPDREATPPDREATPPDRDREATPPDRDREATPPDRGQATPSKSSE